MKSTFWTTSPGRDHMTSFILRMHGYCHPLPRFSLQDKCSDPRKNVVFEEIGLEMLWRKKKGTPRKSSAAPIISKINKTLISWGIIARGSGKP